MFEIGFLTRGIHDQDQPALDPGHHQVIEDAAFLVE